MYITCKRGTRGTFNTTNRPTCDTVLNNYHLFIIFCGLLSVLGLCTAPSLDMKSENSILTSQFAMTLVVDNLFHELKRLCLRGSRHVRDTFDDVRLNVLNFFYKRTYFLNYMLQLTLRINCKIALTRY